MIRINVLPPEGKVAVRKREARRRAACEKSKRWAAKNPEKVKERRRAWRESNVEHRRKYQREWKIANAERHREHSRRWAKANSNHRKDRYKNDTQHRMSVLLRNRMRRALAGGGNTNPALRDLGCSIEELKRHLESQFKPGMTWENWSREGWHIDHIKPLATFDLTDPTQVREACHYTNLQPLWASENCSKGARHV